MRNFLGGFFGRNYLVEINKELMFLSRFCLNAQGRKEGQEFRSLEVRGKLIALKKEKKTVGFKMPPKIHEVKQIEGKSLGIVAVNDISKGTLILKETPQMSHIVINALTPNLRPVVGTPRFWQIS